MDDLLTGCNNFNDATIIRDELIAIMRSGGFELCKWASNEANLLPESQTSDIKTIWNLDRDNEIKTLGLVWDSKADTLNYKFNNIETPRGITKRNMLSFIARLFDPLGLINPVITKAKIMLQKAWMLKLEWDETIPADLSEDWVELIKDLTLINCVNIPRKVITNYPTSNIELHGFCDASQEAYGAVIYVRSVDKYNNISIQLLCAKSRIAPIKTISIPRLELCGALLLSRLLDKVGKAINLNIQKRYLWTDSSIVLSWIAASASTWQTFVANRVSEIQQLTSDDEWNHINSEYNPADIISRGANLTQTQNSNLWWTPHWLQLNCDSWPKSNFKIKEIEASDEKRKPVLVINAVINTELPIFNKFSNYYKLQRVIAYVLRFINNCKNKINKGKNKSLTCEELETAAFHIVKCIQINNFTDEIKYLKKNKQINKQSKLFRLNAFLDDKGLIRVGGRLKNSNLNYNKKYPIVLPSKHHVTKLIIIQEHERQLHAGAQSTLCAVRQNYWPISGRNTVRSLINKCMKCFRANPISTNQMMGDLPASRVTPTRPFNTCGVDYAGPIIIKQSPGRGKKTVKAYIALFICFSTKAIHLELVSDLSTDAFLGALKRFMSRRGKVAQIHSDNGTNFVGADKELKILKELFDSSEFQIKIIDDLASAGIKWNFIPARSPHRGGLWEAGIKQTKNHLRRVIGNTLLTYEELYTLLTQIEACLNSRPITPLSSDPNDLEPLTPGHFLIGDRLLSNPEPDLTTVQVNRLSRWQHIQQMMQHFWQRWQREYLANLQQRSKWVLSQGTPLVPGTAVLLVDNNLPPLTWRMGRITALHPGKDNIVRTVSVKTSHGVVIRAANKVCVLPVDV